MSATAMEAFRTRLLEDESLQEEMQRALGSAVVDAVAPQDLAAFAAAHGFDVDPSDVDGADALDDAALEGVSGGAVFVVIPGTRDEPTPEEQKKIDEEWGKVPVQGPAKPGGVG